MANFVTFIPIALFVALCMALFKIHRLNSALAAQQADNLELVREMEKAVERNSVFEQRLKKESEDRGAVELKYRDCWREKDQNKRLVADTSTQLQYKIQENFALTKQLEEAKQQVEVKKKEVTKAAEEAVRYRDLFEAGNRKVDEIREAYVKLKEQVDAGLAKPSGIKVDAESVVRRDADEGKEAKVEGQNNVDEAHNETGKAQEEQNQVESHGDKKPSDQEPPQQQQQEEEKQKEDEAAHEAEKKEEVGEARAEEGEDREQREAKVDEERKDGEEKDEREMPVAGEERKIDEEEEEEGEGEGGNKGEDRAKRSVMMDKLKKRSNRKAA